MCTNRHGCIHVYMYLCILYIYIYTRAIVPIALNVYTHTHTHTRSHKTYIGESMRRKSSSGAATFDSRRRINVYSNIIIPNRNKSSSITANRKTFRSLSLRCIYSELTFFFSKEKLPSGLNAV